MDTAPNTTTPPVQIVATVLGRLSGRPFPAVGEEGVVWMSRPRVDVIDFYPATQTTNPERTEA